MMDHCRKAEHSQSVGNSPDVAYHLTTVRSAPPIASSRAIRSRHGLTGPNDYANDALVRERSARQVAPGTTVNDCVPLYFSRFQPMFVRLCRKGDLAADEVIALEVSRRIAERVRTFTYSTNPVYESAAHLGPWELVRLPPSLVAVLDHGPWRGMLEADGPTGPTRPMIMRQAEVLVEGEVPVEYVTTVWAHPRAVAEVAAIFPDVRLVSCRHLVPTQED